MEERTFTATNSEKVKVVTLDGKNIFPDCMEFTASPFPNTPQMGEATVVVRNKEGVIQVNAYHRAKTMLIAGMIEWSEED